MSERLRIAAIAVALTLVAGSASAAPVAKIAVSRTDRCTAPCAIFFDATATTDASAKHPFHELDFSWEFGDERGETWSVSGQPKNRADGGIAGHLFTRPGNYEVTLSVANEAGQRATAKTTIAVADPDASFAGDRTRCVSVSGAFDGCPAGADQVHAADFDASLQNADGRRTLFRRGETFRWDRLVKLADASEHGAAIDAFGPGDARAEIVAAAPVALDPGNDWRVANLSLRGIGKVEGSAAFFEPDGVDLFTVSNVEVRAFNTCATLWSPLKPNTRVSFVDVTCRDFPEPGKGTKFYEDTAESMYLGLDIDKGNHSDPRDQTEFAYRTVYSVKKLIQHGRFRGRAPNMSKNLLQLRHCEGKGPWAARCPDGRVPSRWVIVSDNQFVEGGGPRAITVIRVCDHASCLGKPGQSQPLSDYIFERNLIQVDVKDAATETLESVFMLQGAGISVRDNVADLQGWPRGGPHRMVFAFVAPPSNPSRDRAENIWITDNVIYLGDGYPGSAVLCSAPRGGSNFVCAGNLLYAPKLGGSATATMGSGFQGSGNRLDGPNPFAKGPPPKGRATLRDLGGFQLRKAP
jgi:hypothetical protein